MLERIFKRDTNDEGIAEDKLLDAITEHYKKGGIRNAKRKQKQKGGGRAVRGQGGKKYIAKINDEKITEEAKASANKVVEAMRYGFLTDEYSLDLGDPYGSRTYRKKKEEESEFEFDEQEAKEIDAMAEKFHSLGGGHKFTLKDVHAFFGTSDDPKVRKLCKDLKNEIFDDLFITRKTNESGGYIFTKKTSTKQ